MNAAYLTNMTDSQWSAILVILKDKRKRANLLFNPVLKSIRKQIKG
jgi:hypothetical protein